VRTFVVKRLDNGSCEVRTTVQGSSPQPYAVRVAFEGLATGDKAKIVEAIKQQPMLLGAVLRRDARRAARRATPRGRQAPPHPLGRHASELHLPRLQRWRRWLL
jgi:hypothetical protein